MKIFVLDGICCVILVLSLVTHGLLGMGFWEDGYLFRTLSDISGLGTEYSITSAAIFNWYVNVLLVMLRVN